MNEATEEFFRQWLIKTQENWDVARVLADRENPPASIACFHCQQCVEKLLKAVLIREQVEFPKTHDLGRLIELVGKWVPELTELSASAKQLTIHGVETRYPDDARIVDDAEMREVIEIADKLRNLILRRIQ